MQELPIHYAEVESIYNQTIGSGYKTLAITSAKAGEGKTTIAQAIVERAQIVGKKVLLVEMNTFNPALSEKLRSIMTEPPTKNSIIPIESKGYSFLPAPTKIQDILQYRESNLLLASIKQWLVNFDCIIFDTSALTSLNQSNIPAEIICEVCEGALLVIEAGTTPANLIQESVEKLKLNKVNLIGSIINDKCNPSLLTELQRETYRLNRLLPNLMVKLRKKLASLVLLNISV
ncbi:tyrosine-protein kinase family protein [Colwellia psychrerythraea]|uniref:AAA domain containing protein n=1 Tax=Colwellia psychrerythraea TaxID=28229 RepID=A0A099K918_COLPS|nr:tyrosine-protein kinase family protein [Colwellia psychrerythraea]KGJ86552.1 AAA domain containing protein [Colwellia psychrerythraea]